VKLTFAKGAPRPDPTGLFNGSLNRAARRDIDICEGDQVDQAAFKARWSSYVPESRSLVSRKGGRPIPVTGRSRAPVAHSLDPGGVLPHDPSALRRSAMELSAGQLSALRDLRLKKAGQEVDWVNIADARALTDFGLAERNREGWIITAAGEAALEALAEADGGP